MSQQSWTTRGFEEFSRGAFGNSGQNLYVSRQGVLQRIHQTDLNGDGHMDLVFCNSQGHWERVPTHVYSDLLNSRERVELPAEGAWTATVCDLNLDGYDDLVLGCLQNGVTTEGLNAIVYFGDPEGWSERRQQQLPAPDCLAVAAGDFNGDSRPDLAFQCAGFLRVFYQTDLGLEPKRYSELALDSQTLAARDLDGDGHADLIARSADGTITI